jgi:hypothetical protein
MSQGSFRGVSRPLVLQFNMRKHDAANRTIRQRLPRTWSLRT